MRFYKKVICILLLCTSIFNHQDASASSPIEVFSIDEEKVVFQTASTAKAEDVAKELLTSIDGLVTKINPIPSSGFLVKIHFSEPYHVHNYWFDTDVTQAVFVYEKDNPSSVMLINQQGQSVFFTFDRSTLDLFHAIHYEPSTS